MLKKLFLLLIIYSCNNSTDPGSSPKEEETCSDYFSFNQSIGQASYFIINVTIDGNHIGPEDGVAAYNSDLCVGFHQWDTSLCNNNICEIIAMGNDGSSSTEGYCENGDSPIFKIYDASEKIIYNTIAKDENNNIMEIPSWSNNSLNNIINNLEAVTSSVMICD